MSEQSYISIYSPLNNELLGSVIAMSKSDVDNAVDEAIKCFSVWKTKAVADRIDYLYKTADLIMENAEELTLLLIKEIGKDRKSAYAEVTRTADFIRFTADTAKTMNGQSIVADSFPGAKKGRFAIIHREPVGVVLAISPFNYPINLAASKIAPAIVGGNTVIFKPATQGCLSGIYLYELFKKAGLPKGVINVVTGKGSEIGDYIVTHSGINFINFTGSTHVGEHISKQSSMIPLLMELGGKDAAIVLEDADISLAAGQITAGAFSYSAQRCTAIKRVLVVEEVADELVSKILENTLKLKLGNPLETSENVDIVPLINKAAADFVEELIKDAKDKGAKLLCGGNRYGNLIEPTLFDYVSKDMRVAWEEPFGPVLPIIRVKSMNEAVEIANKSDYGLQSSVFTRDINKAFEVADRLEVGTVQINNKTERGPDNLPFLGVKSSGIGVQGISYSIEAMTRIKSTVISL